MMIKIGDLVRIEREYLSSPNSIYGLVLVAEPNHETYEARAFDCKIKLLPIPAPIKEEAIMITLFVHYGDDVVEILGSIR